MAQRYRPITPTFEVIQWGNNSQASTPDHHVEARPGNDPRVVYDPEKPMESPYVIDGFGNRHGPGFGDYIIFWSTGAVETMHPEQFAEYIKRFEPV